MWVIVRYIVFQHGVVSFILVFYSVFFMRVSLAEAWKLPVKTA